jgi:hypothetical protein
MARPRGRGTFPVELTAGRWITVEVLLDLTNAGELALPQSAVPALRGSR